MEVYVTYPKNQTLQILCDSENLSKIKEFQMENIKLKKGKVVTEKYTTIINYYQFYEVPKSDDAAETATSSPSKTTTVTTTKPSVRTTTSTRLQQHTTTTNSTSKPSATTSSTPISEVTEGLNNIKEFESADTTEQASDENKSLFIASSSGVAAIIIIISLPTYLLFKKLKKYESVSREVEGLGEIEMVVLN